MKVNIIKKDMIFMLQKIIRFILPYKIRFISAILCLIISTVTSMYQPLVFGKLVDYITNKKFSDIPMILMLNIVLMLVANALNNIYMYMNEITSNKIKVDMKKKIFESILSLPTSEFENTQKGEFITKLEDDVNMVTSFLTNNTTIIIDICTVIFIAIILFKLNLELAIVIIISFPINFVMFMIFGKYLSKLESINKIEKDKYNNFIQESINGFNIIKILNGEHVINAKFFLLVSNIYNVLIRKNKYNLIYGNLSEIINCILYCIFFIVACYEISKGNLTIGSFVAFATYSSAFNSSMLKITQINSDLQQGLISIKRILKLTEKYTQIETISNNDINENLFKSDIKIKSLFFKYKNNSKFIFQDLNMNIKKNKITAIIGKNGQGKTTLLKLLMGLYKNYNGDIMIGKSYLKDIKFNEICEKVSYVPQETFLFTGTIKENLLIAAPNSSDTEIVNACRLANIDTVINSFKDKYNTQIGYNGLSLSVGQKQRLGIARALLRNADLFLFDEITSAVDNETEENIKKILKEIAKNKTVILVSHKKTTFSIADDIIVLEDGQVKDNIV